jgi:hypothetical protein
MAAGFFVESSDGGALWHAVFVVSRKDLQRPNADLQFPCQSISEIEEADERRPPSRQPPRPGPRHDFS